METETHVLKTIFLRKRGHENDGSNITFVYDEATPDSQVSIVYWNDLQPDGEDVFLFNIDLRQFGVKSFNLANKRSMNLDRFTARCVWKKLIDSGWSGSGFGKS